MIRKVLLETLENELPRDSIRYSSKVVHIESDDCFKSIHLADGTIIKTKVISELRLRVVESPLIKSMSHVQKVHRAIQVYY